MSVKHMSDLDARSVIIDIPKSRLIESKAITFIKKKQIKLITRKDVRKPSETSMVKYLLPERQPLTVTRLKREEILMPYRLFAKQEEKQRFKLSLQIKTCDVYKAISTDLRKRLYIDGPVNEYQTIADVDPDFFLCVNGSLLSKFVPRFKSLKHLFNNQIRLRQVVGSRYDCILSIITNIRREYAVYDKVIETYKEHVKHFDDFISYDYQKSMLFLSKWDEVSKNVTQNTLELQNLAIEKFTITSKILGLDYRYGQQQKYGRFLYYLSPSSWRSRNRNFARSVEIEARGFDFGNSSEEDTFNVIFEKLQKEIYEGLVKPVLYFTDPEGLMRVFEDIEQQQLYNFAHVTRLAPHAKLLKHVIKYLNDVMAQDSACLVNTIKRFENLLEHCEERSSHLQAKFFKILNGMFYESVGTPDVLKLHEHLEFCYEKVYNQKPINMDITATARVIERFYMDYSKMLDGMTGNKIKKALKRYEDFERQKFRKAQVAARELRCFERLERELQRAHAPPVKKTALPQNAKRLGPRKQYSKPKLVESNRVSLTEVEKEYLLLFTDWTGKEDPSNYMRCLSETKD